ncbi:hypothetical protein [Devosia sp. MC1541]|uniref:hypothetical protein n=1 Tax=Devosia sp. MC1541 TaxID=2725264 RepID=UPI00145FBBEB|nr:hypothetical protein [Devosia sp. MC1541]
MATPERDPVYTRDESRTVYTRESNGTGWFVGIIVALALLAIGYLVFSANTGPATVDTTAPAPAIESTAPMTEAPATDVAPPAAPAAPEATTPAPAAPAAPVPPAAPATPATPVVPAN